MPRTTPKPASGVCKISDDGNSVHINGDDYKLEPLSVERTDVIACYRLTKMVDGEPSNDPDKQYECWQDFEGGHCTCAAFIYGREKDETYVCKHAKALRSLGKLAFEDRVKS